MTEFQTVLNSLLVNVIINGVLFLILLVLYGITLFERWRQSVPGGNDFSRFIAFFAGYVGLMVVCLPAKEWGLDITWLILLNFVRMMFAMAAYSCASSWILYIIEEREMVPAWLRRGMVYGPFCLFGVFVPQLYFSESLTVANIPILLYYVALQAMVIYYRRAMGKLGAVIFSLSIVPSLLLQAQEWWNYTPANIYLVMVIVVMYGLMWSEEKEKYLESKLLLAQQMDELENMRTRVVLSQIQPHFIYNVISTIAYLCTKIPELAQSLTFDFAAYLRVNLSAADVNTLIPFEKELEHVKTYLRIEKVRFDENLNVVYDIQATDFMIPVLTVEPLVENAVKHGVCRKDEGGTVTISTRELSDCWQIIIKDDGAGFNANKDNNYDGHHIGLRSVASRIRRMCKGKFSIDSKPGDGTVATIMIPKNQEELI